ncbi:MAG: hypothetical protein HQL53_09690 [Magnetococcales bacterium]|nr:hypothetical protein [Magnetococcales bacterium]
MNDAMVALLRKQLEGDRTLISKFAAEIALRLDVDLPLDGLRSDKLKELEPFEQERLLSTLYTPDVEERIPFEALMGPQGITQEASQAGSAAAFGVMGSISFGEDSAQFEIPEVVIERYVRLLFLDKPVDDGLASRLAAVTDSPENQQMAMAEVRHRYFSGVAVNTVLKALLDLMKEKQSFSMERWAFLMAFLPSVRIRDMATFTKALRNLVDSYREDNENPIFNQRLEDYQGGSIRSKYCGPEIKNFRLTMAKGILEDLGEEITLP